MKADTLRRGATFATLGLGAVGALLGVIHLNSASRVVRRTIEQVPQAKPALEFRGRGFGAAPKRGFVSDVASAPGQGAAQTMQVTAPELASGEFSIKDGAGADHGSLRLVGAAKEDAHLEHGALVYTDAYAGVDVVVTRDPARFEVSYVAKTTRVPPLAIRVGDDDGALSIESDTGAAVLRGRSGKPRLRATRPVAFDAAGQRREGAYVVADVRTLRIDLDVRGMTPPIVIDPAFYIPFWTLQEEGRGPGNFAYDRKTQSREGQIVLNTATGKPWLIRPLQSLKYGEERMGADRPDEWYSAVSATPRTSGQNGPTPDPLAALDLRRTVNRQSETYEWNDDGWRLLPHADLPNLIDPTFAFDAGRGRAVTFSGRLQGAGEQAAWLAGSAVYENDGTGWKAKGVPGAPTPRIRAASVGFGSKVLVFGGRTMPTVSDVIVTTPAPTDLLNDTWLYDGKSWQKVPVSNPPPACESAQLVHDTRRDRIVLVGGNCSVVSNPINPSDTDGFRLWEFDGTDWMRRFDIDDVALPKSFRMRTGVAAAWNPVRRTTMLFGGFVDQTELCALSDVDLAAQRHQARIEQVVDFDLTRTIQLQQQGCWGGYVHDTWEWDGTTLRALTRVAYGATVSDARVGGLLFQQVSAAIPAPSSAVDARDPAATTKLWPWRYDASADHFAQRSALERAAAQPGVANAAPITVGGQVQVAAGGASNLISPVFVPGARPQLVIKPDGKLLVFSSDDGRVLETDLVTWTDRTPSKTPFAQGQNDFFAAAWDSARQMTILFDPATAATWEHDAAGWKRMQPAASPGPWSSAKWARQFRDGASLAKLPRMAFDRVRARTLMLYGDALWEYDGASWLQRSVPVALRGCVTSPLVRYDGVRARTVVVGCTAEGQTWEWDGSAWLGPFASPFQAKIARVFGSGAADLSFRGTLQMSYMHPDALFESPTLGGVALIDGDGTLRVWKGSEWLAGASFGDPTETDAEHNYMLNVTSTSYKNSTGYYPPVVEDFSANRLLAFRDGIRGLRELPLLPQPASAFVDTFVGDTHGAEGVPRVHPFPAELLPLDIVGSQGIHDPTSVTTLDGTPTTRSFDTGYANLAWSFRLLPDPTTHRVRVLTNRGNFWELGSERTSALGEECSSSNDCTKGEVCSQGVCCEQACDGRCLTCNGANPGKCEAMPAGSVDPQARCGAGECAGVCAGVTQFSNGFPFSSCSFTPGRSCGAPGNCSDGEITGGSLCSTTGPNCLTAPSTPRTCGGGLECADAGSCKPACSSPADCAAPHQICAPDGMSCISDGKLCHSDAECPKFNDCAPDGKSCKPDAVLAAATARGTSPSAWQPELVRTPSQIAAWLRGLGYPDDGHGRIILDTESTGPLRMVFDPQDNSPVTGFRYCMQRINQCRYETGKLDECVTAAPRCVSDSPSPTDPGGFDCCPEACLLRYFELRSTLSSADVMVEIADGSCYPHLQEDLGIQ